MKPLYAIILGYMLTACLPTYSFCGHSLEDPIEIIDIVQTEEVCNLSNGTITINVSNPLPTMLYSVDGGINFQTSNFFDGLESGDYLIIVTDGISCSQSFSVQIADAPEPEVDVNFLCIVGLNEVDIEITPFPTGIFPFTYDWIGPNNSTYNTRTINGVDPGTYSVTVTDRLGCVIDTTFSIEQCCALELVCPPDTVFLDCLSEMQELPSTFLNDTSENNQDSIALSDIDISVNIGCNEIIARANVQEQSPSDCSLGSREVKWMFDITDGVSTIQCEKVFIIDNYLGLTTNQEAQDINVDCTENVDSLFQNWISNNGFLNFSSCSDSYNTFSNPPNASIIYDCPGNGVTTVSFIVEDECSNQILNIASFNLTDNTPPIIICPSVQDFNIHDNDLELLLNDWVNSVNGFDNCSNINLENSFDFNSINIGCDEQSVVVNFIASDECQNISECTSSVNLINNFAPSINCPGNLSLTCVNLNHQIAIDEWLEEVNAFNIDNTALNTSYNTSFQSLQQTNCGDEFIFEFIIDENCAQGINCYSTLSFNDEVQPNLLCPSILEVSETNPDFENVVADWLNQFTANDNCVIIQENIDFNLNQLVDPCSMPSMTTVSQFAEDACGNISECFSNLEVLASSVEISCPSSLTLECGDENNAEYIQTWLSEASAFEDANLSLPIEHNYISNSIMQGCGETQLVTFTATNSCDRSDNCQSEITIIDSQAPTVTCPSFESFEVNSNGNAELQAWLNTAIAEDACTLASVTHDFNVDLNTIICAQSVDIKFTAFDECGNTSECQSTVELTKESSIDISCPEAIIVQCNANNTMNTIFNFIESYNVSADLNYEVYDNFNESLLDQDCTEEYEIDINLTVIDLCDNRDECETMVQVFPEPKVYIPNIFSPNSFGQNSSFTVYSNSTVNEVVSLIIFNRWGSKIYENYNFPTNEESEGWDGIYKDKMESGYVYTYYTVVSSIFGETMEFTGTIQIVE